ncbi:uncharacterized protein LOC118503155 [Anopheles stephensi]|uniref:uncharacterized protein LOC118503155 n=1 Tax=Anopheles stephensi TaxID=30069 RepID=UPI001658A8A7|nr:uncharacterized protein LOC118503155 [Anopheles stephensi]
MIVIIDSIYLDHGYSSPVVTAAEQSFQLMFHYHHQHFPIIMFVATERPRLETRNRKTATTQTLAERHLWENARSTSSGRIGNPPREAGHTSAEDSGIRYAKADTSA